MQFCLVNSFGAVYCIRSGAALVTVFRALYIGLVSAPLDAASTRKYFANQIFQVMTSWAWHGEGVPDDKTGRVHFSAVVTTANPSAASRTYHVGDGVCWDADNSGGPGVGLLVDLFEVARNEMVTPGNNMRCVIRLLGSFAKSAKKYLDKGFLRRANVVPEVDELYLDDLMDPNRSNYVGVIEGRAFLSTDSHILSKLRDYPQLDFRIGDVSRLVRYFYPLSQALPLIRPLFLRELGRPGEKLPCRPKWTWIGEGKEWTEEGKLWQHDETKEMAFDGDRVLYDRLEVTDLPALERCSFTVGDAVCFADRRSGKKRFAALLEMFQCRGKHSPWRGKVWTLCWLQFLAEVDRALREYSGTEAIPGEMCFTDDAETLRVTSLNGILPPYQNN